jgi:hypothetical protein
MSLTSSFITKTGEVTVTLETTVFTGSDTFEIIELGEIEYDIDVTSYGDVVNNLGAMYNRTKIVVGLYTGDNRNIFDLLYDEFLVAGSLSSQKVNVNLVVTRNSVLNLVYRFRYEIRSNGLKYTENTNKLTIELDPFIDTSLTVSGVFFGVGQRNAIRTDFGLTLTGIMTGSFIRYTISGLNTNLPTIHEPAYTDASLAGLTYAIPIGGAPPSGINSYVLANASFSLLGGSSGLALEHVAKFAVLGGDFYGTGFDANFYVNRRRTDRARSISLDNIESLTYQFTPSAYKSITLSFDGNSNLLDFSTTIPANQYAEKSVSGFYSVSGFFAKASYIPASGHAYTQYAGYTSTDIEFQIVASGILAHQKALNADITPFIRVEATLFGFDSVKPYEAVQFIGDVPDKYKFTTGTNPRYFRPTSMSYNLMDDKVKLKMYSIN